MDIEIIALCLTIAGSVGGGCWFLGNRIGVLEQRIDGVEKGLSVRIDGIEKGLSARIDGIDRRLTNVESDIHDIRADIRSLNEYMRKQVDA